MWEHECRVSIGWGCIKELRYTGDTTPSAKSMKEMREMLKKVVKEIAKMGLKINLIKTNIMAIGQNMNKPFKINGKIIKQVLAFNYLGSYICIEDEYKDEIICCILWLKELSNFFSLYWRVITSQTTELWMIKTKERKKITTFKMRACCRLLRVSWTEHMTNWISCNVQATHPL